MYKRGRVRCRLQLGNGRLQLPHHLRRSFVQVLVAEWRHLGLGILRGAISSLILVWGVVTAADRLKSLRLPSSTLSQDRAHDATLGTFEWIWSAKAFLLLKMASIRVWNLLDIGQAWVRKNEDGEVPHSQPWPDRTVPNIFVQRATSDSAERLVLRLRWSGPRYPFHR